MMNQEGLVFSFVLACIQCTVRTAGEIPDAAAVVGNTGEDSLGDGEGWKGGSLGLFLDQSLELFSICQKLLVAFSLSDEDELITALSCGNGVFICQGIHGFCQADQHLIAGLVTIGVIDLLEVVDIEHFNRK